MDILLRLTVALGLIALGALAYTAWGRWQLYRLGRATAAPGLEHWQPGTPGLLYFTSPTCAPCRTTQRPAIERVLAELGPAVQLIEIDASAHTTVADHWGVLSVPTTFVLDPAGRPAHVNHGVTAASKLKQQFLAVSGQ